MEKLLGLDKKKKNIMKVLEEQGRHSEVYGDF